MTNEFGSMRRAAAQGVIDAARRRGLEDVAVATIGSPVGDLLVAGTRRGLVRVAYPDERPDLVMEDLAEALSPRVLEDPRALDLVRRQLEEYFEGRRDRFEVRLDWALAPSGFSRK